MTHGFPDPILRVVGRIYDAALDPAVWPEVAKDIAELQAAPRALLFSPMHSPAQGGFVFPVGITESELQEWADRYVQHDVWSRAGMEKGLVVEGNVVTDEDLVPHEEFLQSVMWREYLSRQDVARVCSGVVFDAAARPLPQAPPPTVMAVYRGLRASPFGAEERQRHRAILPHLSRALGIMFRLRDAEMRVAASLAALDRLSSGVLLFGARKEVCFANRAAQDMLAAGDGLRLRADARGTTRLEAAGIDGQRALGAALEACLAPETLEVAHFSRALTLKRASGRDAYLLQVSALPHANEFGSGSQPPRAIAFLSDPARPARVDEALLRRLYGLTPAECRLAEALSAGETIATVAVQAGVSENTIRSQLKSIFDKTSTRRQAQLIKLMMSLASQGH